MDIDKVMFFVPTILFSIFAAYYAMKFTYHRRIAREEAAAKIERERSARERKARNGNRETQV